MVLLCDGRLVCGCADAIKHAVMTDRALIPDAVRERLALILHDAPPPK